MAQAALAEIYRDYIACLNRQDWLGLEKFVQHDVRHNGTQFGLADYRAMLERDFEEIPNLTFNIELIVCESPFVASRLKSDWTAGRRTCSSACRLTVDACPSPRMSSTNSGGERSRRSGRRSTRRRSKLMPPEPKTSARWS
jgi:hypothetical protein